MENKLIPQVISLTSLIAALTCLAVSFYYGFLNGCGVLLGAGWGIINFYFLKLSLQEWLSLKSRNRLKIFCLLQIKFPLLYFIGYELIALKIFSILSFLAGFSLIFPAIFLIIFWSHFKQMKFEG